MEKILIIDDDVQLSKLIEEFLQTFNYEITIMHEPKPALVFNGKKKWIKKAMYVKITIPNNPNSPKLIV